MYDPIRDFEVKIYGNWKDVAGNTYRFRSATSTTPFNHYQVIAPDMRTSEVLPFHLNRKDKSVFIGLGAHWYEVVSTIGNEIVLKREDGMEISLHAESPFSSALY